MKLDCNYLGSGHWVYSGSVILIALNYTTCNLSVIYGKIDQLGNVSLVFHMKLRPISLLF